KTTIAMAAFFMLLCIVLSILPKYEKPASVTDIIEQQQQAAQAPPMKVPAAPGSVPANPAPQSVPAAAQPVVPSSDNSPKN
ncbi:MAG TPA: preprotein translocase subunit SecG, partial [bacterium]|nr:preprotein translocase subunit SecG [bacterium]